jgi:hypothetical protein
MSASSTGGHVSLDQALVEVISSDPQCIAAGWVDTETGMLIRVKTGSEPQEGLELVSTATTDIFERANVVGIEQLFKTAHGVPAGDHYFREIIVKSRDVIHVFARGQRQHDPMLVVIVRVAADLGVVIHRARWAVSAIEPVE